MLTKLASGSKFITAGDYPFAIDELFFTILLLLRDA